MKLLRQLAERASRVEEIPLLSRFSPSVKKEPSKEDLEGFLAAQTLALKSAREVEALMKEGWTEIQAARLMETILRDYGVKNFFHRPFVWCGENTRFRNVHTYKDFQPTKRRVLPNEVVILDVAPVFKKYTCDIGHTFCFGQDPKYTEAMRFLKDLKDAIPAFFNGAFTGKQIWDEVDNKIKAHGYDNIHALYPYSVLGHRVHLASEKGGHAQLLNFEWHSYWNLISRGMFGQILSPDFHGGLEGLWAIEPHIGTPHFGAKFEEILIVDSKGPRWLSNEV